MSFSNFNAGGAVAQSQSDPIYSLPFLYISGLNISVPAATSALVMVAPGQARDMNDVIDMPVGSPDFQGLTTPAPLIINSAVNGVNGLDQGVLVASDEYAIWLIGDSRGYNPVAGLLSLSSAAAPLLPKGYDSMRLLGYVSTNGGALFTPATVRNSSSAKAFYAQPNVSVLAGGNSTVFAAVALAAAVPANVYTVALLVANYTPAVTGDTAQFRWTGSPDTTGLVTITGVAAGVPQQNIIAVLASAASSIDYKVSNAGDSLSLLVSGYIQTLS